LETSKLIRKNVKTNFIPTNQILKQFL